MLSHKGSMPSTTQNTQRVMGKILVAGKRLNLGIRGPGEKPSWGETRSSGTGGSHPGQVSWSVSGGEAHIPQSPRTKGNQEGWPSCVEYRSGGTGVHTLEWIFFRTCLQGLILTVGKSEARDTTSLPLLLLERKTAVPHPRNPMKEWDLVQYKP